jgi:hypothetical protein
MPQDNPFKNYGILDMIKDIPYSDLGTFIPHAAYYEQAPQMIQKLRPDLAGPRVDRNLQDMMLNFIGGYDFAARGVDPQRAMEGARAFQGKQYMFSDRKPDAIGDYNENVAGVQAFNPEVGRLSDEALIDMALRFARDRMATEGQRNK